MKTKIFLLILLAAFVIPVNTQAQVGNYLKKKLEQAVSKEATKEAEKSIDEKVAQQDTIQKEKPAGFKMPNLGIGKVTAKYEENYDFKGVIKMKTEVYEKGKVEAVMDIDSWFNLNTGCMGMETSTVKTDEGESISATAIIDTKNKVMITFAVIDGGKSGMIMLLPDSASTTGTAPEEDPNIKIRKTGNTRTICGYKCDEYEVTEVKENVRSLVWTTEDLKFKTDSKLMEGQQGMPRNYKQLKGVMMASETYEKGTLTTKMEVTKIDMDATHSISTAGATLMQMDMSKWGQKKK